MSEAENLLNALSDEGISVMSTSEEHIVVNADRTVTVPESLRNIAVQFDHNIETVTFDCPRYWDGNDLSVMAIYINYRRPDNKVGCALMEGVTVDNTDDSIMHFNWRISGDVTAVKGNISFLICAKQVDINGVEELHWNSHLNQQMIISEGLECAQSIIDRSPDIITQLLLRMNLVESAMFQVGTIEIISDGKEPYVTSTPIKNPDGSTTHVVNFGIPSGKDGKDGNPGVYVGDGEMPYGYTVQVVPNGNILVFSDDFKLNDDGEIALSSSAGGGGKSAYEYAKDGGYTGTEAEFAAKLAAEYIPANTPTDHVAIFGTDYHRVKIGDGDITFMGQGNEGVYVYCENGDGTLVFYSLSGDQAVRLENIATPINDGDAANKGYVDDKFADQAETWTFTLENGSTVTKKVVLG